MPLIILSFLSLYLWLTCSPYSLYSSIKEKKIFFPKLNWKTFLYLVPLARVTFILVRFQERIVFIPCYHIALLIHLLLSLFSFTSPCPQCSKGLKATQSGGQSGDLSWPLSQLHLVLLFLEHFQKEKQLSQIKPSLLNPFFLPIFLLLGLLTHGLLHALLALYQLHWFVGTC